jgi:repressor LexA
MLCFIAGYIEHHGYAPSLREMAEAVGLASKSGLRVLARLEVRGMIRRRHNLARAVEILHAPALPRAPDGAPLFFVPVKKPLAHGDTHE